MKVPFVPDALGGRADQTFCLMKNMLFETSTKSFSPHFLKLVRSETMRVMFFLSENLPGSAFVIRTRNIFGRRLQMTEMNEIY